MTRTQRRAFIHDARDRARHPSRPRPTMEVPVRFIVNAPDGRFVGGITCTAATRDHLRSKGYRLLPA